MILSLPDHFVDIKSSCIIWQTDGRLDWFHLSFISCHIDFAIVCQSMSFAFYESWFIKLQVAIIGNHYTLRLSRELSPFKWKLGGVEGKRGDGKIMAGRRGRGGEKGNKKKDGRNGNIAIKLLWLREQT